VTVTRRKATGIVRTAPTLSFSRIIIWGALVLGVLPLAGIVVTRAYPSRRQAAHAKTSEVSGPEAASKLGHAFRLAAISLLAAVDLVVHPHGLVDWLVIGVVVVILLWEPANRLTAYLVRRSKDQGIT